MDLQTTYQTYFKAPLQGRYITLKHIEPLLKNNSAFEIFRIGFSEKGKEIPVLKFGAGTKRVLMWSQMHGNESTTTKAVFDFLQCLDQKAVFQKAIHQFLNNYTVYLVPILNPDGAEMYTRVNANEVDLNRDAKNLTQKESVLLNTLFKDIQPELCLNLHDQRSIFGLETNKPATVSFLSPSANKERSITNARKKAMCHIVNMQRMLEKYIPGQVGRYDDTYNENCVGDSFTTAGVPTILFEAGHFPGDYQREKTREFIFYALLNLFGILSSETDKQIDYQDYFSIPENQKNYRDVILYNVKANDGKLVSIGIQFEETLKNDTIEFIPVIKEVGDVSSYLAHKKIDIQKNSILINSHENIIIGEKVLEIHYKNNGKEIIFQ